MKELYTRLTASRWRMRRRRYLSLALMTGAVALAACIYLCTQVSTATAEPLLYLVIGLSTLAGWAVMLLVAFGHLPARAEAEHIAGMLEEPGEEVAGVLNVEKQQWHIPHSIRFCRATITDGEEKHPCQVNARMARQLPANGTVVCAVIRRRFITAYEVQHEEK